MSLYYLSRPPKVIQEKNPLLVLIHGYGSNEEDLFSFASELPEEYYIISLRAPFDMQFGSYAWYSINFDANENKFSNLEEARISRDLIANFIDELILKYPIDKDNISLLGFSQGSVLSYAIALSYPEKIKKVVALSGYLNLEILTEDYQKNDLKKLKIFTSHGTVDQVIPVDWARKSKPILDHLKIDNVYKEYPVGHGVNPQNFYDFRDWLINN
jgi:phospholipase/carboxylesterase